MLGMNDAIEIDVFLPSANAEARCEQTLMCEQGLRVNKAYV